MTREYKAGPISGPGVELTVSGYEPLPELTAALNAVCDKIGESTDRDVVVLRIGPTPQGNRSWPVGADVHDLSRWERAVRRFTKVNAATISVAHGTCAGAALSLLLATDYRMCTRDLRLLLPINDGRFWPGMALHGLVHQVGAAHARRVVMWRNDIGTEEARDIGLIDRISDDIEAALHEVTVMFGRISGGELAIRRQLLAEATTTEFDEALGVHLAACDRELRRLAGRTVDGRGDGR